MQTTIRRLGVLLAAASIAFAACSGSGSTAAPSTAASAPPASAPAASVPVASAPAGSPASGAIPQPPSGQVKLQGAGATFPAPLYQTWFETYGETYANIKIDYQANGSGAGIKAITEQTVDFGASDAAMKDDEVAKLPAGTKILHVPTALGAVVIIYNLPGVTDVKLDAQNVADLFLGKITTWNDPKIAANNAGVPLPATPVFVAHRSDGSGTTNAFTAYLDKVSPEWHTAVGAGKEVKWPAGVGAQGNDGVAGSVKQNPGGVGYVELNYATTAKLQSAKLKNADGTFVSGSVEGVTAAAEAEVGQVPADFRQAPIINGPGANTYPIASYTYILVYQDQKDATKAQALVSVIAWTLTEGQAAEAPLGYAPLPTAIQQKALASLHTITAGGAPVWP